MGIPNVIMMNDHGDDDDDDDDDEDDEWFLRNGGLSKGVESYFQPGPLS